MQPQPTTAQRITDAACDLFVAQGVRATTVDQIAAEAGCSRMTVYRHFPGKRTLLRVVVLEEFSRHWNALDAAWGLPAPLEDRLANVFVELVSAARTHPLVQRLLHEEPDQLLPALTLQGEQILSWITEIGAPRLRTEPALLADADVVAELLCRLAMSLVLQPYGHLRLERREELEAFARAWVAPMVRVRGDLPAAHAA